MKRTTLGVETWEIYQPQPTPPPGGGPPIMVYEPITENPGNVKFERSTFIAAQTFALNKKSEGDGLEVVYDSEVDGV
jgi:hypothetical protein